MCRLPSLNEKRDGTRMLRPSRQSRVHNTQCTNLLGQYSMAHLTFVRTQTCKLAKQHSQVGRWLGWSEAKNKFV